MNTRSNHLKRSFVTSERIYTKKTSQTTPIEFPIQVRKNYSNIIYEYIYIYIIILYIDTGVKTSSHPQTRQLRYSALLYKVLELIEYTT